MPYGEYRPPAGSPVVQVQMADRTPMQYDLANNTTRPAPRYPASSTYQPPSSFFGSLAHYTDVGIFRDTLLPTLAINLGLSTAAYATGRALDRIDAKDWLWPAAPVINAWWSALGRKIFSQDMPVATAINTLSWPERLLLAGVTAWGARLFYRNASRSMAAGKDAEAYREIKTREGQNTWNWALVNMFLPETLLQTLVALPFTAPFRHGGGSMTGYSPLLQAVAVGLFGTGLALETFADSQLAEHERSGKPGLLREGVWSIVRHPNYLGAILIHFSFPLLLFSKDMFRPIELLGPLANYYFLRYVRFGGGAEAEARAAARYEKEDFNKRQQLQEYRAQKGALWPKAAELGNTWVWTVVGCGAGLVAVEEGLRRLLQ